MTRLIKPLASLVALLLLAGSGSLAYHYLGGADKGTYDVTAYFTKTIGLFENSDVDILGVPVGKVTNVDPVGTHVRVDMEVSNEHKVPADAFAQIVPISVISDRYIQLHPVYQGGPALQDGDVIPASRTQIPAELDDVFKQLKKLLDAVEPGKAGDPGALGELIVQLDKTLSGREQDLRGTLINASKLTSTLAGAEEDISGLLVNVEDFFGTLATRAGSFGTLNKNLAIVMTTLAESRQDLQATLANLATLTEEVGDFVRDNRGTLGKDLRLAAELTSTILKRRESFEQGLNWLPVAAEGLRRAYHKPPFNNTDVRDNVLARLECEIFDDVPPGPVKDEIEKFCREHTGEPEPKPVADEPVDPLDLPKLELDCDKSIKRAKRQIERLQDMALPKPVRSNVVRPLGKKLERLRRECKKLGKKLEQQLLDKLDDIGEIPSFEDPAGSVDVDALTGNAAGRAPAGDAGPGIGEQIGSWMRGLLGFVGWRA